MKVYIILLILLFLCILISICIFKFKTCEKNIPRVLHFIWLGGNIPPMYRECIKSWKEKHPSYKLKIWTDKDVTPNFQTYKLINEAKKYAQKADILRYEILYKYGGIYLDCDMLCMKGVDSLLKNNTRGMITCNETDDSRTYCTNAFIAAIPKHPILKKCVENAKNIKLNTVDVNVQSGPYFFRSCFVGNDYKILPTRCFYSMPFTEQKMEIKDFEELKKKYGNECAIHLWGKSWL